MANRFKRASAFGGLSVLVLLSGCVGASGPSVPPPMPPAGLLATCGADKVLDLIGQPIAAFTAPAAAKTLRILRPGDPVTEDFSESRLNVILDDKDHISALSCG